MMDSSTLPPSACLVCDAPGPGRLWELKSQGKPYTIYGCANCRSGFTHPIPGQSEIAEFYSRFHTQYEYSKKDARLVHNFRFKHARLERIARQYGLSFPLKILDVGCGLGQYLSVANEAGHDVNGVDFGQDAIDFARRKYGLKNLHQGDFLDLDVWPDASFDVITMWAVIEHLRNPHAYLDKIRRLLKPGGLAVVETGAINGYLAWWQVGPSRWMDPPQHLYYFSRKGVNQIMAAHGLNKVWDRLNIRENWAVTLANHGYSILHTLPRGVALRFRRAWGAAGEETRINKDCNIILSIGRKSDP